jgi:hypothetical protein
MRVPILGLLACCLASCGKPGYGEVDAREPPPDAPPGVHRYVFSNLTVPQSSSEARQLGLDVDGDGAVDNQLGMVLATLSNQGLALADSTTTAIDRGDIIDLVEITADMLTSGPATFTMFEGANPIPKPCGNADTNGTCRQHLMGDASFDLAPTSAHDPPLAGSAVDGSLLTPVDISGGRLTIVLSVENTPVRLHAIGARASVAAASGMLLGGGIVGGALSQNEIDTNLIPTLQIAFMKDVTRDCPGSGAASDCACAQGSPGETLLQLFDTSPTDCKISVAEIQNNSLIQALLAPDISVAGQPALSVGFGFEAVSASFAP